MNNNAIHVVSVFWFKHNGLHIMHERWCASLKVISDATRRVLLRECVALMGRFVLQELPRQMQIPNAITLTSACEHQKF